MAKVIAPLHSLSAHGAFHKKLVFQQRKLTSVVYLDHSRKGTVTEEMQTRRDTFYEAKELWKALSPSEKAVYNYLAKHLKMTGYNLYIQNALKSGITPPSGPWYNASWLYRQKVTVSKLKIGGETQENFPVFVNCVDLSAGFFTHVKEAGADIRVTKSDMETEVAIDVEGLDKGGSTGLFHFLADSLSVDEDTDFYVYYGNSSASAYAPGDTYGRNAVWANDFKMVLHFGEASYNGTPDEVVDSSGNDNSGAATELTTTILGKLWKGASFTVTPGSFVVVPRSATLDGYTKMTISMWVKTSQAGTQHFLFKEDWRAGDQEGYGACIDGANNKLNVFFSSYTPVVGVTTINDGEWHHLLATYNSVTFTVIIYVDGEVDLTNPSYNAGPIGTATDLCLGRHPQETPNVLGIMDEVRISSIDRSAPWVLCEFNNQNSPVVEGFYAIGEEESKP